MGFLSFYPNDHVMEGFKGLDTFEGDEKCPILPSR